MLGPMGQRWDYYYYLRVKIAVGATGICQGDASLQQASLQRSLRGLLVSSRSRLAGPLDRARRDMDQEGPTTGIDGGRTHSTFPPHIHVHAMGGCRAALDSFIQVSQFCVSSCVIIYATLRIYRYGPSCMICRNEDGCCTNTQAGGVVPCAVVMCSVGFLASY